MPKRPPKVITPPAPTAPGGLTAARIAEYKANPAGTTLTEEEYVALCDAGLLIPSAHKPLAHADSPALVADSAEYPSEWRCPTDGQRNTGKRCTTCGGAKN